MKREDLELACKNAHGIGKWTTRDVLAFFDRGRVTNINQVNRVWNVGKHRAWLITNAYNAIINNRNKDTKGTPRNW